MSHEKNETGRRFSFTIPVPNEQDMCLLGAILSRYLRKQDIILLSGPLGAGKTTLARGIARGLHIDIPIVSPTFTIAREMNGTLFSGKPIHLIHIDAYRLDKSVDLAQAPVDASGKVSSLGHNSLENLSTESLLDELESLGLDEKLEACGQNVIILMEWGENIIPLLSSRHLDIVIERPSETQVEQQASAHSSRNSQEFAAQGMRYVTLQSTNMSWKRRLKEIENFFKGNSIQSGNKNK